MARGKGSMMYGIISLYRFYHELEQMRILFDQIETHARFHSIIQRQKHSSPKLKGFSSNGYHRKTSFSNKRFHWKRKKRIGL